MSNSKRIILFKVLLISIACSFLGLVNAQDMDKSGKDPSSLAVKGNEAEGKNIFSSHYPTADIQKFEAFAKQMARLKPFGRVDVSINNCAEKADFEIPPGGSPWHEYASYNQAVHIFFPDVKLIPFLPADFVNKNKQLLLSKAAIIRRSGLEVAWAATDPLFLPEAFFEKYPHMRGPRVDHPRRSLYPAFAACFHQQETIDMYKNMVTQLFKNVPEINTFRFHINDAGSGQCWSQGSYTGPNGPAFCKNINISESVFTLLNIYKTAARQIAGHDIDISFDGFRPEERADIDKKLKEENLVLVQNNYPSKNISSLLVTDWPARGIINPLQILRVLNRTENKPPFRYSLSFGDMYDRGNERLETIEKVIDMVEDNLKNPSEAGVSDSVLALQALKKWCVKWAGEKSADQLFNTFVALDEAIIKRDKAAPRFSWMTYYFGVSARHITRPLLIVPQRLTPDEEKYFLPHIFNVSVDEARNDYMDLHGSDYFFPLGVVATFLESLKTAYTSIGSIKNAPEQKFLDDMARSLHIYYCVVRSCGNFSDAQIIRNRNKEILAGPVHRPSKIRPARAEERIGDRDLQDFNGIVRDEFDNTQDLIDLLENGGLDLIVHAQGPYKEDTFLLGANLIEQLKLKRKIMMVHWRDIEGYLTTPYYI
jgi:hypothetical protein